MSYNGSNISLKSGNCPVSAGTLIAGRYAVIRLLHTDETGWIVEARDLELERERIALKMFFPHLVGDRIMAERLHNDALVARQLTHPNIVRIHDLEYEPQVGHFISMEFIEGWTLRKVLRSAFKELRLEYKIKILREVALALSVAHRRSVVHRDLRPENIFITKQGEVKVGNFGFSRSLEASAGLTRTGEILGTPEYMAPEQFFGKPIDCQTDIFAFGILAHELCLGRTPWPGLDYLAIGKIRESSMIPPLDSFDRSVPQWLPKLLESCCRKETQDRLASGAKLLEFLDEEIGTSSPDIRHWQLPSLQRAGKRRGQTAKLLLLLGLAFCGIALYSLSFQGKFRKAVGPRLLQLEQRLDLPLKTLKQPVGIRGNLSEPQLLHRFLDTGDSINSVAMISAGCNLTALDANGRSALNLALSNPNPEIHSAVLDCKPPLDFRDGLGVTPLEQAVKLGLAQQIRALLAAGANPNLVNPAGDMALHIALDFGDLATIKPFLGRASLDSADRVGNSPLHTAIHLKRNDIIELLLLHGASVNTRDALGRTPLMVVLQNYKLFPDGNAVIEKLLSSKAYLSARDDQGNIAAIYAARFADSTVLQRVLNASILSDAAQSSGPVTE